MNNKYVVGLDFGTLSGRAVVVRASDGAEMGSAVHEYPHGVMDRTLSAADGRKLPPDFALQDPADYLETLEVIVRGAVEDAGVDPGQVVGIGLDVTSATVVAATRDGTALCQLPEFRNEPHAWVKLWKHHGAQDQADRIVKLAQERREPWLARYGGILSSEMLMPKVLETLERAPQVYRATDVFCTALDWLTWRLTGVLTFSAGDSGYKRMYQDGTYPSRDYLMHLNPEFADVFTDKMNAPVLPLGARVGGLTPEFAERLGLPAGITVASGNIDAHVTAAAVQAVENGQMTAIMGTSACYVVPGPQLKEVPGMFGVVDGGIVDGSWGFEAGQTAVGDIFAWFIDNCVPGSYFDEADHRGIESFRDSGVEINELVVAGGLTQNTFLMQLFCDICRVPLSVGTVKQPGSHGSAVFAAVAADLYPDVKAASAAMGAKEAGVYQIDEERAIQYDALYAEYARLHDYFGRGGNQVMHRLKEIRRQAHLRARESTKAANSANSAHL